MWSNMIAILSGINYINYIIFSFHVYNSNTDYNYNHWTGKSSVVIAIVLFVVAILGAWYIQYWYSLVCCSSSSITLIIACKVYLVFLYLPHLSDPPACVKALLLQFDTVVYLCHKHSLCLITPQSYCPHEWWVITVPSILLSFCRRYYLIYYLTKCLPTVYVFSLFIFMLSCVLVLLQCLMITVDWWFSKCLGWRTHTEAKIIIMVVLLSACWFFWKAISIFPQLNLYPGNSGK